MIVFNLFIYNICNGIQMLSIGVIGNGFVGKVTNVLRCDAVDILFYDLDPKLCVPVGTTMEDIVKCDLIFVSVPTPMNKDGSPYLKIVESVLTDIGKLCDLDKTMVVLRSTVPPGTSDRLNCYFMPEFLTEKNCFEDFRTNDDWIFGLKGTEQDKEFMERVYTLFLKSYNEGCITSDKIHFVKNSEAEMCKMFRNNFLATKVAFCNEMYEYCQHKGIDYDQMRKLACLDKRIGMGHSAVPGPDGQFGYGGTCFPKDTHSLLNDMNKYTKSYVVDAIIRRNEEKDRPEKDWNENKGRSVV